jgi:hypothetical protein
LNIMGDLSSRRGMVQGMEERFGSQIIRADVPLAEMCLTFRTAGDDFIRYVARRFRVVVELHAVGCSSLRHRKRRAT